MKEQSHENKSQFSTTQIGDYRLILLNDDNNTFDYVIQTLVEVCQFDYEKAEQCALITHLKGQYPILSGDKKTLEVLSNQLQVKGIGSKIQKK